MSLFFSRTLLLATLLVPVLQAQDPKPAPRPAPAKSAAEVYKERMAKPNPTPARTPRPRPKKPATGPRVDLNRASKADLMTVPGFTAAIADAIIAKRPFNSTADLASRGLISDAAFLAIKDRVLAVYVPRPAK